MESLKKLFGTEALTFEQLSDKLKSSDEIKLADLKSGDYVSKQKYTDLESQANGYQEQLKEVQETLKGFENIDVGALKEKIAQLEGDLNQKEQEYQTKLAKKDFDSNLSEAIRQSKGKNPKAVMALLDMEALQSSNNQNTDMKQAIEALKETDPYLFESDNTQDPPPQFTGGSSGNGGGTLTKEAFKKMGYLQRKELKDKNPEQYKKLSEE